MFSVLWGLYLICIAVPATAQAYRIIDLGVLPGGTSSRARAINNRGDVAGSCRLPGGMHVFLYHRGKMVDQGPLGGFTDDWVIDDNGRITVRAEMADQTMHKFVYYRGVMMDLGVTAGTSKRNVPFGGLLVGYKNTSSSGVTCGSFLNKQHHMHAFVVDKGHVIDIGTLPSYSESEAVAISADGEVLCNADDPKGPLPEIKPFLWRSGKIILVSGLPAQGYMTATGFNGKGLIVGAYGLDKPYTQNPILYDGKRMINLNNAIPAAQRRHSAVSGWTLMSANKVNGQGQIIGEGFHDGKSRAFILTPLKPYEDQIRITSELAGEDGEIQEA